MEPTPSPPYRRTRAYVAVLVVLAAALAALALPGTAMATPCGDKVLADWFDNGRIDRLYPLHCYEEAIDAIPDDLRDYANAEEIISRALQAAVNGNLDPGGPDPTPGDGGPGGPGNPNDPNDPNANPDGEVAPDVDTTGISSVPIPLLVLGGMSLALLAAGGLGYLSRRRAAAQAGDGPDDDLGPPDDLPE